MNYQDAMQRAIALRLRAKNENNAERREALLSLAKEWESWANTWREAEANGSETSLASRPAEDI